MSIIKLSLVYAHVVVCYHSSQRVQIKLEIANGKRTRFHISHTEQILEFLMYLSNHFRVVVMERIIHGI